MKVGNKTQPKKKAGFFKVFLILLFILVGLGIAGWRFISQEWNRSDEKVLRNVHPVAEIAAIPDQTGMNETGKAIFYRGEPTFVEGEEFRKYCLGKGELALGCALFGPGKGPMGLPIATTRIYLLKITDPKFASHVLTTAAHEMLHVAYRRLGASEKETLDALIGAEIAKRPDDENLKYRIEAMKRMGTKYQDEIHSQLGVLYPDLSPELEKYYQKYFADRSKLLAIAEDDGLNNRVSRLETIAKEAEALNATLTKENAQLQSYQQAGDQQSYNSLVGTFNSHVNTYNTLVNEANRINEELKQFYEYIDPNLRPPEKAN